MLQNLYQNFEQADIPGMYSIGLHPWYIHEATVKEQMAELKKNSLRPAVLAIGECGLDKICTVDYTLQQNVFTEQLKWANEIGKPLIIHCVKAHEDVLRLLLKHQNKVPVIFHGFNKSKELAQKIVSKGCYISFGKALQHQQTREVMLSLPPEFVFLETDDANISIRKIYEFAAAALQINEDSLSLQLQKNAVTVFGVAAIKL